MLSEGTDTSLSASKDAVASATDRPSMAVCHSMSAACGETCQTCQIHTQVN